MAVASDFIKITSQANEEIKKLLQTEKKPDAGLRLGVKGGGCSGLSYNLEFTAEEPGDTVIEMENYRVFIDTKSLIYLKGMQLDHEGGLGGKGFVFKNPNASSTCGCGESFSVV